MSRTDVLRRAVGSGDAAMGRRVLRLGGVDLNAFPEDTHPLLIAAVLSQSNEVVSLLLDAGADPNSTDDSEERWSALMWAAHTGFVDAVQTIVAHGTQMEQRDTNGMTALFLSVWNGDPTMVGVLLDAGADPDTCDRWDRPIDRMTHRPDVTALLNTARAVRAHRVLTDAAAEHPNDPAARSLRRM